MRLKSAHSALVVLAMLLMHGMAHGQKDELSHGPATNATGRNATAWGDYWSFYGTCHNDAIGCSWGECSWFSTCDEGERQIESTDEGCGFLRGSKYKCCDELDLCNCGECCFAFDCSGWESGSETCYDTQSTSSYCAAPPSPPPSAATCASWASAGECTRTPDYMFTYCAASCQGLPPPRPSPSPPPPRPFPSNTGNYNDYNTIANDIARDIREQKAEQQRQEKENENVGRTIGIVCGVFALVSSGAGVLWRKRRQQSDTPESTENEMYSAEWMEAQRSAATAPGGGPAAAPVATEAPTAPAAPLPMMPFVMAASPVQAVSAPVAMPPTPPPAVQMQVTLPPEVVAGQQMQVQTPSGQMMTVTVPAGVPPGGQFMVTTPAPTVATFAPTEPAVVVAKPAVGYPARV